MAMRPSYVVSVPAARPEAHDPQAHLADRPSGEVNMDHVRGVHDPVQALPELSHVDIHLVSAVIELADATRDLRREWRSQSALAPQLVRTFTGRETSTVRRPRQDNNACGVLRLREVGRPERSWSALGSGKKPERAQKTSLTWSAPTRTICLCHSTTLRRARMAGKRPALRGADELLPSRRLE